MFTGLVEEVGKIQSIKKSSIFGEITILFGIPSKSQSHAFCPNHAFSLSSIITSHHFFSISKARFFAFSKLFHITII